VLTIAASASALSAMVRSISNLSATCQQPSATISNHQQPSELGISDSPMTQQFFKPEIIALTFGDLNLIL
jgi:hypothetical protein